MDSAAALGGHSPDVAGVATELGMGIRTLQRRKSEWSEKDRAKVLADAEREYQKQFNSEIDIPVKGQAWV